uniref:Beta-carotene isomerase D27-like C-terminal domain-containing protein n=1 Tax=Opuntia streptacantha TaxID=393608 RepID=A0A7C8Z088_OPUST
MEGSMLHSKSSSFIFLLPYQKCLHKRKNLPFRPLFCMSSTRAEPQKTVYRDNWLDVLAINHFSHNLQAASGIRTQKTGYEGLLEACKEVTNKFNPMEQRRVVFECLERAIPVQMFPLILSKTLLPQTRSMREIFATFTALFCAWLVGPIEVFGELKLCGNVHKPMQVPNSEIHQGLSGNACHYGS